MGRTEVDNFIFDESQIVELNDVVQELNVIGGGIPMNNALNRGSVPRYCRNCHASVGHNKSSVIPNCVLGNVYEIWRGRSHDAEENV